MLHLFTENETTVEMLMKNAPLGAFSSSRWGGQVWRKLKEGSWLSPGWDRLQLVDFWQKKSEYGSIHRILNGSANVVRSEIQSVIAAEKGRVVQMTMEVVSKDRLQAVMTRQFIVGPVLGMLAVASAKVIVMELDVVEEIPTWITLVLQYDIKVPLVLMGPRRVIQMCRSWMKEHDVRKGQRQSELSLYLDEASGFGDKDDVTVNYTVTVLTITPFTKVPQRRNYISLKMKDIPGEVYEYLIATTGAPVASFMQNVAYIPCKARTVSTLQMQIAEMDAKMTHWQAFLGCPSAVGDLTTFIAGVQKELTRRVEERGVTGIDRKQWEHVMRLLRGGETISKDNYQRERTVQEKEDATRQRQQIEERVKQQRHLEKEQDKAAAMESGVASQPSQAPSKPAPRPRPPAKKRKTTDTVTEGEPSAAESAPRTPKKRERSSSAARENLEDRPGDQPAASDPEPAVSSTTAAGRRRSGSQPAEREEPTGRPSTTAAVEEPDVLEDLFPRL